MTRFRSTGNTTPVRCRHCGVETVESMADHMRTNDDCPDGPNHDFVRVE